MGQLILIALATFVSEDLTCIATGALIASGMLGFLPGVLACVAGIFFGDLLLYFAGRLLGRPIVRWKPLRKILSEQKLDLASNWLAERGASVVILSRFTPGLRLPTYVAAGVLKTRFWTFATYFLLAAVLWTPALVGAAALLGRSLPQVAFFGPAILIVGVSCRKLPWRRPSWQTQRRMIGWIRRKTRWEFWPPWLAYIPVLPYVLYLGIKHRSLDAVYRGQSRHSIRRLCRRIEVGDPVEPRPCSRFSAALRRSTGRRPNRIGERVHDGAQV